MFVPKIFHKLWEKLNRQDPAIVQLYGQELLDQITNTIKTYQNSPQKGISKGSSIKNVARRISIQDGNKEEMVNNYLAEIKKNLLTNIAEFDKLDTLMSSGKSDAADAQSVD